MIARNSLTILVCLALPAFAQETAKSTSENPTFDDLRNSLGDLEQKESKDEKSKREAIVQKNVEETLKIYSDTLGKKNGDMQNVNRRLEVNKGLETKYDRLLKTARNGLATTRAQFINRTISLKKSLDEGKISKDAYEKLLDEDTKRFRNRERELQEDISFYLDEFNTAQRSSKDLSTRKEMMTFDPFGGNKEEAADKEKPAPPTMAQKVKSTLGEVSGYGTRSVVDSLK